jgi:NAD(P)-dependent dehydrogenase (short-subunit alcohol dehydrogenase family)
MEKIVLITGASSGIGLATAELFARKGWKVYAGFRKTKANIPGCEMVYLDVCDRKSMGNVVRKIERDAGRLDALINNAGYGLFGSLEDSDEGDIRRVFETNVIGLMVMTKLALPLLRKSKGKVVNISSMVGKIAFPLGSIYASTKFAVEGLSDSIRVELAPFGVKVVVVEPGAIRTKFSVNSLLASKKATERKGSVYSKYYSGREKMLESSGHAFGLPAEPVARAIFKACESKNPGARYVVAGPSGAIIWIKNIIPTGWFDWILAKVFRLR